MNNKDARRLYRDESVIVKKTRERIRVLSTLSGSPGFTIINGYGEDGRFVELDNQDVRTPTAEDAYREIERITKDMEED